MSLYLMNIDAGWLPGCRRAEIRAEMTPMMITPPMPSHAAGYAEITGIDDGWLRLRDTFRPPSFLLVYISVLRHLKLRPADDTPPTH